jgi:thiol-disulfide isomerase/thioredoxin
MKRRTLWLAGGALGALGAAAGGVTLQRWLEQRSAAQLQAQTGGFWTMRFPTPEGGEIAAASLRGRPLLLNFWGTWCPPCIKEMPELDRFAREHAAAGWRVLGLAVDNPKAVRDHLARSPVSYTIGLAGFEGSELTRRLGNTQSGLPFTVAFDKSGAVTHRKAGATTLEELQAWAKPT